MAKQISRRAKHALTHLRKWEDPILKQVSEAVAQGEDISYLVGLMHNVMAAGNGVGLAAPQVGHLKRVILVQDALLINPVFTPDTNGGKDTMKEGCLSFPGIQAPIERWKQGTLVAENAEERGKRREVRVHSMTARVIQHEIDHLAGICLVGDYWREHGNRRSEL